MFLTVEDTFRYMASLPKGNLLEFGVYHADCLRRLIQGGIDSKKPFDCVYGFDSWKGLPLEAANVWHNPDWTEGAFSVSREYGLETTEDCINFIHKRIFDYVKGNMPPINLVSGFFKESLTESLGQPLSNTVSYCHVDVDLYISTKQCLGWMFQYRVPRMGCLFRFDDWLYGKYAGNNKAFDEISRQYEVKWLSLADNVYIYQGQKNG